MPDFTKRSRAIEIMDDLACSGEVVAQTLRELETINYLLGGNRITLDGLGKLIKKNITEVIEVVDVGCGSGDMLRLIWQWSQKKDVDLKLTGIDANPFIVDYASTHTQPRYNIRYRAVDIFSDDFRKETCDIVIGTLFFHHFTDEQLIAFFSQLKNQVRIGFIINDIHRHSLAYYSIKWLTRFLSRSEMVKYDAPLSVLRAFKKKELLLILRNAGIVDYTIRWMWAFRWQVIVRTS
jgi:2-polyprenyl-3-methyl-5-hydroxy-6-metoxy-1,4-benzoquinol methylase